MNCPSMTDQGSARNESLSEVKRLPKQVTLQLPECTYDQ